MTDLEKLRAGLPDKLVTIEGGLPTVTIYNVDATESIMRQAADEIEELRREVAKLTPLATVAEIEHRLSGKPLPGDY